MIWIVGLLVCSVAVFGQEADQDVHWELSPKLIMGGSFGLQLGTITQIEVSPIVGWKLMDPVHIGVGGRYLFFKDFRYDISQSVYGGSSWIRFAVLKSVFLQAEYEVLSVAEYDYSQMRYTGRRNLVEGILVGGAYRQEFGKRSAVNMIFLWNIELKPETPYANPVIKIEYNF